jgi:hypothetical protein
MFKRGIMKQIIGGHTVEYRNQTGMTQGPVNKTAPGAPALPAVEKSEEKEKPRRYTEEKLRGSPW